MFQEATRYFSTLFSEDSHPADNEENIILSCIPSLITQEMNNYLMRPISLEELEEVDFGMPKAKAPCPNGFPIEFFPKFWDIINHDFLEVVKESYSSKQRLWALNSTFLTLIPKREGANQHNFFGPLALCNVKLLLS